MTSMDNRTTRLAAAIVGIAAVAVVGGVAGPANADFYKFTFGGVIDVVDGFVPEPWDTVHVGSEFEFSYIFDSEAEDHHWSQDIGFYYLLSAEILIDGEPQATSVGDIEVNVDMQLYRVSFIDLPMAATASIELWGYWDAFETDELPLTLDLDDFPTRFFSAHNSGGEEWEIGGIIDTFSGEIVPTPASLLVMSGGLILCRRRYRARN